MFRPALRTLASVAFLCFRERLERARRRAAETNAPVTESERIMGTRLYVGNLPFDVDETQLRTLFERDGRQVTEVKIITDRETGRPRGFAFVEMGSQGDATAAISALNGTEMGGRALTVNEARESERRGGGGGGGGRRRF
jgi:RNA recognition motif-containing protein